MDFFKSVFSEDPQTTQSDSQTTTPAASSPPLSPSSQDAAVSDVPSITSAWSFGSKWIKTLASKSESVIDTYRRDLEDFSTGLKKETATIRDLASRAVKDLPSRLETGAAVAQESLESVGQAIDDIGSTVSVIVAQGKNSILDSESDSDIYAESSDNSRSLNPNEKPYSRIDAMILAVQSDIRTYSEEPEDLVDYNEWMKGFVLEEKTREVEELIKENKVVKEIHDEIVSNLVDRETFWIRYFYRVSRVLKAEEARARLVKRAILGKEEEELSWDVDDPEDEGHDWTNNKGDWKNIEEKDSLPMKHEITEVEYEEVPKGKNDDKFPVEIEPSAVGDKGTVDWKLDKGESSEVDPDMKPSEKTSPESKNGNGGSGKDSDYSVVSSQPSSHGEDDLGWDEIEDIESGDESRLAPRISPFRADLRKRLSAADEVEVLSWDIEDDDEPVKS